MGMIWVRETVAARGGKVAVRVQWVARVTLMVARRRAVVHVDADLAFARLILKRLALGLIVVPRLRQK
jgi:hypothetical protein